MPCDILVSDVTVTDFPVCFCTGFCSGILMRQMADEILINSVLAGKIPEC